MSNCYQVLLPTIFYKAFDYLAPDGVELVAGQIVSCPFGKQELLGVVWGEGKGDVPPNGQETICPATSSTPSGAR